MRALVIDDSMAMRSILGGTLKRAGFEVTEAVNGQDALQRLGQGGGPYALAMIDWNMPVMNGYDFIRSVRADPQFAEMQLVMVTTETGMIQVAHALAAGANEYIMKPFTPDILLQKLEILGILPGTK